MAKTAVKLKPDEFVKRLRNHEHVPDVILEAADLKRYTSKERGNLRLDVGNDSEVVEWLMGRIKGPKELRWAAAKLIVCRMLGREPSIESYCKKENISPRDVEDSYQRILRNIRVAEDGETHRPNLHAIRQAAFGGMRFRAPPFTDEEWPIVAKIVSSRSPKGAPWHGLEAFEAGLEAGIRETAVSVQFVRRFGVHGGRVVSKLCQQRHRNDLRTGYPELTELARGLELTGLEHTASNAVTMICTVGQLRHPFLHEPSAVQALCEELRRHRTMIEAAGPKDFLVRQELQTTQLLLAELEHVVAGRGVMVNCDCGARTMFDPNTFDADDAAWGCIECGQHLANRSVLLAFLSGAYHDDVTTFYHPPRPIVTAAQEMPNPSVEAASASNAPAPDDLRLLGRHDCLTLVAVGIHGFSDGSVKTSTVMADYLELCAEYNEKPRTLATVRDMLQRWSKLGVIEPSGRTRGRSWSIKMPHVVSRAEELLNTSSA